LESHPGVTKVVYPGLKSHPQHEIAKAQQHGFGAMITFYCVGGRAQSAIVLEEVCAFFYSSAVHLFTA
jgi:cystathionine gamma-lyase